jgi:SAM-dependent methyltransferase
VRKLAGHCEPGERVFEIGAGIGATVKQFELAGMRASGIEPHDGYREYGASQLHASLEAGVLKDVQAAAAFDLVILHHVLEHLPHPLRALEHVRRVLRLGGRAYVEVPNVAAPHAAPGKQFHFAHIYNFTPATLTAVAALAGLAVKESIARPGEENICFVLTPDPRAHVAVDYSQNYAQTLAALARYSPVIYHLRTRYLVHRVRRTYSQLTDRFGAEQRLKPILQRCAAAPQFAPQLRSA